MNTKQRTRTYEWADPLEIAEIAKKMSGHDFLEGVLKGELPGPAVAATLDFHPLSLEIGKVSFEFMPQEFHYNPLGSVHGGVISTILDTVMGCALHSKLSQGTAYTTLELKVNFIKALTEKSGRMIAEGRLIHSGKTTALIEADLKNEEGVLYAHGTSTCMLFNLNIINK